MAQRKETKTKVNVRDLKPSKDAKGGIPPGPPIGPGLKLPAVQRPAGNK